jgi:hypothetical protein
MSKKEDLLNVYQILQANNERQYYVKGNILISTEEGRIVGIQRECEEMEVVAIIDNNSIVVKTST